MKPRILVIEDNEQNLYLVTFLLENSGCDVVSANNGPDGIKLAQDVIPTLILLDIQLPGMDGYEIARELRKIKSLNASPIVAVSSYAMTGDRERGLAAGCDGYIEKPINPDTFVEQIRPFLPKDFQSEVV